MKKIIYLIFLFFLIFGVSQVYAGCGGHYSCVQYLTTGPGTGYCGDYQFWSQGCTGGPPSCEPELPACSGCLLGGCYCNSNWPGCTTACGTAGYYQTDTCANYSWCAATGSCCPAEGTCTTNCGANASVDDGSCGTKSCACIDCSPSAPTLSSPANGAEIRVGVASTLNWNDVASWGTKCPAPNSNKYNVCLSSNNASCDLGYPNAGVVSQYSWIPSVADPTVYWSAIASNGSPLESWSPTWSLCVEGGPYPTNFTPACGYQTRDCSENCGNNDCAGVVKENCQHCDPTIPAWGATWTACNGVHTQSMTRPCTENDGLCDLVDDCDVYMANQTDPAVCPADSTCTYNTATNVQTRTRDCVGTITGTLFDASDVSNCGQMGTEDKYADKQFTITPVNVGKWPIISGSPPIVSTNGSGVYSQNVYASATLPASYTLDYASIIASGLAAGIKLECQPTLLTLTNHGDVVTKDTGFWRVYGGWWQAVGGSVYAKSGLKSSVPASVDPSSNQKLILDNAGRVGVLAHGIPWTGQELGTNPGVAVSTRLWRIESLYEGLRYDYDYYTTRMNIFESTPWDGTSAITYSDGGGYQILKSTNPSTTLGGLNLSAGQKLIILVDGSVRVIGDIIVPSGAFLAVIAKGNITFDPIVSNVLKAQGWFVAETINVPCHDVNVAILGCDKDDKQFLGEGSFVGWSNISLGRDMNTGNNDNPSEKFVYRPDFVLNAPAPIMLYTRKFAPFIP